MGRKKKQKVKRSSNGRINYYEDPRNMVIAKRIRDKIRHEVSHQYRGYPLGILHLDGKLNDQEFAAGTYWAGLSYEFATIMGLPLPVPKAVDLTRVKGQSTDEPKADKIARIKRDKAVADGIVATADVHGLSMMIATCIEDKWPFSENRLKRVLATLADYLAGKRQPLTKNKIGVSICAIDKIAK